MDKTYQHIFTRPYSLYTSLDKELTLHPERNYLFELETQGIVDLDGEKAVDYLNGQISCNVNQVNYEQIRQGAFCNLKGRIQALADIINWNGLKILLPLDLHEQLIQSLKKTAMFSRVALNPAQSFQIFGLLIQNSDDCMPFKISSLPTKLQCIAHDEFLIYGISKKLFIIIVRKEKAFELAEPFQATSQFCGSLSWHYLKLCQNMVEIYPSTVGELLPHRIGLQHTGHLDFNKGCYKGQEIIARTHYRAKIKHQLKKFLVDDASLNIDSRKLIAIDTQSEFGEIVDYSPTPNEKVLLVASVLIDHPDIGHIEGSEHPIHLKEYMG